MYLGSALLQDAKSADDRLGHSLALATDLEVLQRSLRLGSPQSASSINTELSKVYVSKLDEREREREIPNLSEGTWIGPKVSLSSLNDDVEYDLIARSAVPLERRRDAT